ncbi:hypothetical protein [Burkholderia sp. LMG 21824]|uniref:hypothetical protein n=1 Tax=Burkholderia sp. LMG 21824 TaxID=3158172 RepID=UPI003C2F2C02
MQAQVKLPSDSLIDYLDFCRSIAEAKHPTEFSGIDCVVRKLVNTRFPVPAPDADFWGDGRRVAYQSVLMSGDGRTLNELVPSDLPAAAQSGMAGLPVDGSGSQSYYEMEMVYKLTDDDRRELAEVLQNPALPPLRYPMSEDERAAFRAAYIRLQKRPSWEPRLISDEMVEQRKTEQLDYLGRLHDALQREVEEGRIVPLDRDHFQTKFFANGAFISREQAVAYLERNGFEYQIGEPEVVERGSVDVSEAQAEKLSAEEGKGSGVGRRKLSPARERELVDYHNKLKASGKKPYVKPTAEKFGISVTWVSKLVKKAAVAASEQKIDHLLVARKKK